MGRGPARRSQLPSPQKRPGSKSILAEAFGGFRKTKLPRKIFRIELCNPLPAKKRVLFAVRRLKYFHVLFILLDGFVVMILFLLQEGASREALRRTLADALSHKPLVDSDCFSIVLVLH